MCGGGHCCPAKAAALRKAWSNPRSRSFQSQICTLSRRTIKQRRTMLELWYSHVGLWGSGGELQRAVVHGCVPPGVQRHEVRQRYEAGAQTCRSQAKKLRVPVWPHRCRLPCFRLPQASLLWSFPTFVIRLLFRCSVSRCVFSHRATASSSLPCNTRRAHPRLRP